jgi:hypothetical protein
VHVERDDTLAWFDSDEQAAANVSDDWRWYCPTSERVSPPCGTHASAAEGMREPYLAQADGTVEHAWSRELLSWFDWRNDHFNGDPPMGVRAIVPVRDAIEAGLLDGDRACPHCGASGDRCHYFECPSRGEEPAEVEPTRCWVTLRLALDVEHSGDRPSDEDVREAVCATLDSYAPDRDHITWGVEGQDTEGDMIQRLDRALEGAQEAFWSVLAERFPEIGGSGLQPDDSARLFKAACSDAATTWLLYHLAGRAAE